MSSSSSTSSFNFSNFSSCSLSSSSSSTVSGQSSQPMSNVGNHGASSVVKEAQAKLRRKNFTKASVNFTALKDNENKHIEDERKLVSTIEELKTRLVLKNQTKMRSFVPWEVTSYSLTLETPVSVPLTMIGQAVIVVLRGLSLVHRFYASIPMLPGLMRRFGVARNLLKDTVSKAMLLLSLEAGDIKENELEFVQEMCRQIPAEGKYVETVKYLFPSDCVQEMPDEVEEVFDGKEMKEQVKKRDVRSLARTTVQLEYDEPWLVKVECVQTKVCKIESRTRGFVDIPSTIFCKFVDELTKCGFRSIIETKKQKYISLVLFHELYNIFLTDTYDLTLRRQMTERAVRLGSSINIPCRETVIHDTVEYTEYMIVSELQRQRRLSSLTKNFAVRSQNFQSTAAVQEVVIDSSSVAVRDPGSKST